MSDEGSRIIDEVPIDFIEGGRVEAVGDLYESPAELRHVHAEGGKNVLVMKRSVAAPQQHMPHDIAIETIYTATLLA